MARTEIARPLSRREEGVSILLAVVVPLVSWVVVAQIAGHVPPSLDAHGATDLGAAVVLFSVQLALSAHVLSLVVLPLSFVVTLSGLGPIDTGRWRRLSWRLLGLAVTVGPFGFLVVQLPFA